MKQGLLWNLFDGSCFLMLMVDLFMTVLLTSISRVD